MFSLKYSLLLIIGIYSSFFSQDIAFATETQVDQCSCAIFDILNRYRLDYDIDQLISGARKVKKQVDYIGKDRLLSKINNIVKAKQPIKMFLPAFSFKSPCRNRTISDVPDMAERVGLEQLNNLTREIKAIYPPGAKVTILTGGHLFSDIFKIPNKTVTTYENILKKLAADLEGLQVLSSTDYLNVKTPEEVRRVADEIVPTNLEQAKEVAYRDFNKFRWLCAKVAPRLPNAGHNDITRAALKFVERQIKLRRIIKGKNRQTDPNIIRLSMHMRQDVSKKLGLRLCDRATATPWFGVLVVEQDGSKRIIAHEDVDKSQYRLASQMINGIPCLFYQHKE